MLPTFRKMSREVMGDSFANLFEAMAVGIASRMGRSGLVPRSSWAHE
ncbi:MAG: hypothetical protein RSB98_05435 [Raoultibacter sp.]